MDNQNDIQEIELSQEEIAAQQAEQRKLALAELKRIGLKNVREITNQDRIYIRSLASQYGYTLPKDRPNCKNCYIDAAIAIWKLIKSQEQGEQGDRVYVLKAGVDVVWNGIRINEATLTDELAEHYIAGGFPVSYFIKHGN